MDDEEKKEGEGGLEVIEIIILIIVILAVLALWNFFPYISTAWNKFFSSWWPAFLLSTKSFIYYLNGVLISISILLLLGIIYSIAGLRAVRRKEASIFNAHVEAAYEDAAAAAANGGDQELTIRWRTIVDLTESTNDNDWKQAIIDADIILDQILAKEGFIGDSLGERLRNATKADFKTLEQAGEAHGVRNSVAHGGAGFQLTQHEAKRVINLYKQVFEEFYFI
jgi:hypothetical protein